MLPILILSLLFPAPQSDPLPICGVYALDWGSYKQTCEFADNGHYRSNPGGGQFTAEVQRGGTLIDFTESGIGYSMLIDREGNGRGWRWADEANKITVRLRKVGRPDYWEAGR